MNEVFLLLSMNLMTMRVWLMIGKQGLEEESIFISYLKQNEVYIHDIIMIPHESQPTITKWKGKFR